MDFKLWHENEWLHSLASPLIERGEMFWSLIGNSKSKGVDWYAPRLFELHSFRTNLLGIFWKWKQESHIEWKHDDMWGGELICQSAPLTVWLGRLRDAKIAIDRCADNFAGVTWIVQSFCNSLSSQVNQRGFRTHLWETYSHVLQCALYH